MKNVKNYQNLQHKRKKQYKINQVKKKKHSCKLELGILICFHNAFSLLKKQVIPKKVIFCKTTQ